ncbi:MAG: DUF58 domain-containing protein [Blastocatellia bacterium]
MFTFLRQKNSRRFIVVSALLTGLALVSAIAGGVAGQFGNYRFGVIGSRIALGLALLVLLYGASHLFRNVRWRSHYAAQVPNAGLIFGATILMVTVLALTSGNNLLYVVLAVLLATMIVSVASARVNLWGLKPSVRFPNHIFVGEPAAFEITVKNNKRLLPSFSLSVDLVEERSLPNSKSSQQQAIALSFFPVLPARSSARSSIERRFDRRGIYPVTGFLINTGFPFGFIEQRRFIEWPSEIIVYPQPEPVENFAHLLPLATGRIESRAKGRGSDLYAIRPYLASDHHHHVDWKATAKTGQLMIREFTREDDWRVTVIFDSRVEPQSVDEPGFAEKFERAIAVAAGVANHFINLNGEVRLLTPSLTIDDDSGFGSGQSHLFQILRRLAQLIPTSPNGEELPTIDQRAPDFQIVISPNSTL